MMLAVVLLALVSPTHAVTVGPVNHAATVASAAGVGPGSPAAGVSARPMPHPARR